MKAISTIKSINKSMLMKSAWALFKSAQFTTIAAAMKAAWKAMKLKAQLAAGVVTFQFRKVNGELRTAVGTLKHDITNYESKTTGRKPNLTAIAYFDIEKQAFRSFCIGNLI